jgi:peroxiredoxin
VSGPDEPSREVPQHRLDPDRAAASASSPSGAAAPTARAPAPAPQATDYARRYRSMLAIFGLGVIVVFSAWQFASHGAASTGIAPGQRLHYFAAPLAASTLNGAANLTPPCTLAGHDPRALNICLLARRAPLVLAFYVTGSSACQQQVNTLQAVSRQFPARQVQFAAVAVGASHSKVAAEVRSHHWTIPVAYDTDGRVGALYGVSICPLIELSKRGGIVAQRLIGNHWLAPSALAAEVRTLVAG